MAKMTMTADILTVNCTKLTKDCPACGTRMWVGFSLPPTLLCESTFITITPPACGTCGHNDNPIEIDVMEFARVMSAPDFVSAIEDDLLTWLCGGKPLHAGHPERSGKAILTSTRVRFTEQVEPVSPDPYAEHQQRLIAAGIESSVTPWEGSE